MLIIILTSFYKNENKNDTITINQLKKNYYIDTVTGDGNCLFFSLSNLIVGNSNFYHTIRQLICDYIENKIVTNEWFVKRKLKKIIIYLEWEMIKYLISTEAQIFSEIYGIKIKLCILWEWLIVLNV